MPFEERLEGGEEVSPEGIWGEFFMQRPFPEAAKRPVWLIQWKLGREYLELSSGKK